MTDLSIPAAQHQFSYLALGDSYTIGEMVPEKESFPMLTVDLLNKKMLKKKDVAFFFKTPPVIIARTGWTTDELQSAITTADIHDKFDLVTLLIGVNNQYRRRSVESYQEEFENLLLQAIEFADGRKAKVFVISIPDWGATPYAEGRDRQLITVEIDAYNAAAASICLRHDIVFLDITTSQRQDAGKKEFLAKDGLHPSGKEYLKWALLLSETIERQWG